MNIKWSEDEKDFIRANSAIMKDSEMVDYLTKHTDRIVTLDAVRKVRQKLGITKKPGRGICGVVKK